MLLQKGSLFFDSNRSYHFNSSVFASLVHLLHIERGLKQQQRELLASLDAQILHTTWSLVGMTSLVLFPGI